MQLAILDFLDSEIEDGKLIQKEAVSRTQVNRGTSQT
jgi:hypothetical protein